MKFEHWLGTLTDANERAIYQRLVDHNMNLTKGHNGAVIASKDWLAREDWHKSNYHYQSVEFENHLIAIGDPVADYPLLNNSADHRWVTVPYKRP